MSSSNRLGQPSVINDLLLYRLSRLLSVAGGSVIRLCEGRFGITRREWRLLALLAEDEGLLSSQLAERAQLDRARTSKAITSLVVKKLLQREIGSGDRRRAVLRLTEEGRTLHAALLPLVRDVNSQLLAALPPGEVAQLDASLACLQQRADELLQSRTELPKANRRRGGRSARVSG